jgi:serine/threonine protein phosphatase PrpC
MVRGCITRCESVDGSGDDLVRVWPTDTGLIVLVADGAGGTGRGREAAEHVASVVETALQRARLDTPGTCATALREADRSLHRRGRAAETTAVLVVVDGDDLWGAAVGDSGAWLVREDGWTDLTEDQQRKPLLGSGDAVVVPFSARLVGTLLVATDGLLSYAAPSLLVRLARSPDPQAAATCLVNAVRLPTGALQDDVGLALIRS